MPRRRPLAAPKVTHKKTDKKQIKKNDPKVSAMMLDGTHGVRYTQAIPSRSPEIASIRGCFRDIIENFKTSPIFKNCVQAKPLQALPLPSAH